MSRSSDTTTSEKNTVLKIVVFFGSCFLVWKLTTLSRILYLQVCVLQNIREHKVNLPTYGKYLIVLHTWLFITLLIWALGHVSLNVSPVHTHTLYTRHKDYQDMRSADMFTNSSRMRNRWICRLPAEFP